MTNKQAFDYDFNFSAEKVLQQCETLAKISCDKDGINRSYLTPEHAACNQQVRQWILDAGLNAHVDAAGNIWASISESFLKTNQSENIPTLLLGSHLDTVPNAGKYDGIIGVLSGLEVMRLLHNSNETLPFNIALVGFADEEGSRFGTTLLGSCAVAGTWQDDWFKLQDTQGISLAQALQEFGSHPDHIATCSKANSNLLAYLELHIEQGPVLENYNTPLGVVTSIAGAERFNIKVKGQAGHAGTVPMNMRQDALVAAAHAICLINHTATRLNVVATVGKIECFPGAPNVIPGECNFTLDIRSESDQNREKAIQSMQESLEKLATEHDFTITWEQFHHASAVKCSTWIQEAFKAVLVDLELAPLSLMSGAGHDAMGIASITDIGMLFMRCAGGVSHNPAESVTLEDTSIAIEALYLTLLKIAHMAPE